MQLETSDVKPFPWLRMGALNVGMLAHSFLFTTPLPYVAFMVVDFGMEPTTDEAGYWAGWIASAFLIGRILSGIPWGNLADKLGRKPCLLISMGAVCILNLLFGLSTTFAMAVSVRFSIGIFNGFMSTARICVTELAETKEHEVRGFGYLNGAYGLGMVLGPAIGGLLARPAIQYPGVFSASGLWGRYPYLLPSVVCSLVAFSAFISILLFVPETASFKVESSASKYEIVNNPQNMDDTDVESLATDESDEGGDIELCLVNGTNAIDLEKEVSYTEIVMNEEAIDATVDEEKMSASQLSLWNTVGTMTVGVVIGVYCTFSSLDMLVSEVLPLYCVTSFAHGGLSWNSAEVGLVLAIDGVLFTIFQLFIYEHVMKIFTGGSVVNSYYCILFSSVGTILTPIAVTAVLMLYHIATVSASKHNWLLYASLIITTLFYHCASSAAFCTLSIIINNVVDSNMRGSINGLVTALESTGQALGSLGGATLYAFLVTSNIPAPFDGRLVFIIAGLLMVGLAYLLKRIVFLPSEV